jgi:hypothetical protein
MNIPARHDGVVVVPWPSGAPARARARLAGAPRLLVVEGGAAPPTDCELDEDWAPAAAPPGDVAARLATLATRPVHRRGIGADALAAVANDLADHAVVVLDALAARWPRPASRREIPVDGDLSAALGELRAALVPAGYDVLAVPGGWFLAGDRGSGRARPPGQRSR